MRRLNREYAGEDETTDVLAFSLREGRSSCRRMGWPGWGK